MTDDYRSHQLLIRIETIDGDFEASIQEPNTGSPHWVMSGPPRPYADVVTEVLEALERHLRTPGE